MGGGSRGSRRKAGKRRAKAEGARDDTRAKRCERWCDTAGEARRVRYGCAGASCVAMRVYEEAALCARGVADAGAGVAECCAVPTARSVKAGCGASCWGVLMLVACEILAVRVAAGTRTACVLRGVRCQSGRPGRAWREPRRRWDALWRRTSRRPGRTRGGTRRLPVRMFMASGEGSPADAVAEPPEASPARTTPTRRCSRAPAGARRASRPPRTWRPSRGRRPSAACRCPRRRGSGADGPSEACQGRATSGQGASSPAWSASRAATSGRGRSRRVSLEGGQMGTGWVSAHPRRREVAKEHALDGSRWGQ